MSSAHCCIAPPAAVRLLETEGCHFSRITVLGFLPSTANASVVPRHGSVQLGLGFFLVGGGCYSSKSAVFCSSTGPPLVGCDYSSCTDGLEHKEAIRDSHHMPMERVKGDPFPTPWSFIIIIIIRLWVTG